MNSFTTITNWYITGTGSEGGTGTVVGAGTDLIQPGLTTGMC